MRCTSPVDGWLGHTATDRGRLPLVFSVHNGYSDRPISVPCGKCIGCRVDRAEEWSLRCAHEASTHDRNCFVTLTYRDPAPPKLNKADLQLLFKRLRNAGWRLRYFACGEYGSRTQRPHYHVLFFGQDFRDGSVTSGMAPQGDKEYYYNPELQGLWGLGTVTIASADPAACFYVAGYSLKNDGVDDCFHLASRRPPLGDAWLDRNRDDFIRNGFVTLDGKKYPVPLAYLRRERFAIEFDYLRDRRSQYVANMSVDAQVRRRESARSRETNIQSAVDSARGTL